MNIEDEKLIQDLRLFKIEDVSVEHGRKRIMELTAEGLIKPKRTPTGRCFLSFSESVILANAL